MNDQELISVVQKHIARLLNNDLPLSLDDNLFTAGIQSISSISLLIELENEFNIVYEDEELLLDNFSTIRLIVEKLKQKLSNLEKEL